MYTNYVKRLKDKTKIKPTFMSKENKYFCQHCGLKGCPNNPAFEYVCYVYI